MLMQPFIRETKQNNPTKSVHLYLVSPSRKYYRITLFYDQINMYFARSDWVIWRRYISETNTLRQRMLNVENSPFLQWTYSVYTLILMTLWTQRYWGNATKWKSCSCQYCITPKAKIWKHRKKLICWNIVMPRNLQSKLHCLSKPGLTGTKLQ